MTEAQKRSRLQLLQYLCVCSFVAWALILIALMDIGDEVLALLVMLLYSCITYILFPLIIFRITRKKLKSEKEILASDIGYMTATLVFYALGYIVFFAYYFCLQRDALSDVHYLLTFPWLTNVAILLLILCYHIFVTIKKSIRTDKKSS